MASHGTIAARRPFDAARQVQEMIQSGRSSEEAHNTFSTVLAFAALAFAALAFVRPVRSFSYRARSTARGK